MWSNQQNPNNNGIFPNFFSCQTSSTQHYDNTNNHQVNTALKKWSNRLIKNTDNTISYENSHYANDTKNKLQQGWNNFKNKFKNTFTNNVFVPLNFYQFHMIDHLNKVFMEIPFEKLTRSMAYEPCVANMIQVLKFNIDITYSEQITQKMRHQTVSQLSSIIQHLKFYKYSEVKQPTYTSQQTTFLLMILTFSILSTKYTPYKRLLLKRIFNHLPTQQFGNTMQVLRYLQNQRSQVQDLEHFDQEELTQINNNILKETWEKYYKQVDKQPPTILLKKISQMERRKVVNILVSGFLSQNQEKKAQWGSLLACMPDSEVYGLDWKSQSIGNLIAFMGTSVKDLLFTSTTLQDKFKDNPFNPAFDVARASGRYLAHMVAQLFPNQFINIIGYSLGSQLIKQFISKTLSLNSGANMQKIILLGGVTDSFQFNEILNKFSFPLTITNMYTANDSVLEDLLKRCRKGIFPIGLKEMIRNDKHAIDNTDVSQHIGGHLVYLAKFGKIAQMLEMNQE